MFANHRRLLAVFGVSIAIFVFGCSKSSSSSHPELAKVNTDGASEWKRTEGRIEGSLVLVHFGIKAGNRVDSPAGEKVMQFGVSCGPQEPFHAGVAGRVEVENGNVKIGFDDGSLSSETWKIHHNPDPAYDAMSIADPQKDSFLRKLRRAQSFQFEFTPKGGKPQLASFKLLNIASLMDQEASCKPILDHSR